MKYLNKEPFNVGMYSSNKNYSKNWDSIFKKSLYQRIKERLDKIMFELFIKEKH
jgi:hypothetical protein